MFLNEKLKNIINKHNIISFDIFDTLLLRPYVKPTDLFSHLEKLEDIQGFAKARIKAEENARKIHSDFEDITIDEIYNEIADEYKNFKSKEMKLELQVLQPNQEMKEVFDYAKKQGKKIIIISDMYLPEKFLSDVLHKKGFDGFEKIYVSCEYRKSKWTGNLYKQVLSEQKIKGKDVLHIGDNADSDKIRAEKENISVILYTKKIDKLLAENLRAKKFHEKHTDDLEVSILLGMLTLVETNYNYWQDFGYKYAGPVILGYMQWLEKQLQNDKISEVMFVARDGYTLEKVFNLIKTSEFKTHYFYAPRNLNLAMNLNYEYNCSLGDDQGMAALTTLLHYYKDKDEFLLQNTPQIKTVEEGIKFIEDNRKLFEKLAQKERKMYAKYFEQFNLKGKNIALVDSCSLLFSAQKSLISALSDKNIKGYYWFVYDINKSDINKYEIKTYQKIKEQKFEDWNIMELFMTAPTPPVEKIDNGKVIYKEINQNEAKRIEIYPDLSQGAVYFAQKYIDVFGKYIIDFACETLIDWVNIFCNIPTKVDKEHFVSIQHAWNQEHTEWQPVPLKWFTSARDNYEQIKKISKFYLLGLPLVKIKKTTYRLKIMLFNFIPFIKYKHKNQKRCFYLFDIPLLQIINKSKNSCQNTKFLLFKIIPILSIKKK